LGKILALKKSPKNDLNKAKFWFQKRYIVNLTKTWLGDFLGYFSLSLGDFLTKTSGHPDTICFFSW
jgi:hypothetical protein